MELGTEATRTGIIGNARQSGYIELKKDVYYILPAGEKLIEAIKRMNISMDKYKTATLGKALKQVYRGEISVGDSVELAKAEIAEVFKKQHYTLQNDVDDGFIGDLVGRCPLCNGNVVRTSFGYGCTNYRENDCRFGISSTICSRIIPKSAVEIMLKDGKSPKLDGFVSAKTGKTFSASLKLEKGRAVFDFDN